MDVVHMPRILYRRETQLIRFADGLAASDSATGEPHGECVYMVVAADGCSFFPHRSTAELTSPDHQRRVEQSPLLFGVGALRRVRA